MQVGDLDGGLIDYMKLGLYGLLCRMISQCALQYER